MMYIFNEKIIEENILLLNIKIGVGTKKVPTPKGYMTLNNFNN